MGKMDDVVEVRTNQQGQILGRKGQESRRKLMMAARKLLKSYSPGELTAASVAKEAKTSSASFYMYFEDTRDVLFALATEATADMRAVQDVVQEPWDAQSIREHASRLLDVFWQIWDEHRDILRYRNLEADRGDPRFEALRMSSYVPFVDSLGRQLIAACPADRTRPTLGQAFATASLLHASIERHASTDPAVVARWLKSPAKLHDSMTHLIEVVFLAGADAGVVTTAPAKPKAKGRARPAANKS